MVFYKQSEECCVITTLFCIYYYKTRLWNCVTCRHNTLRIPVRCLLIEYSCEIYYICTHVRFGSSQGSGSFSVLYYCCDVKVCQVSVTWGDKRNETRREHLNTGPTTKHDLCRWINVCVCVCVCYWHVSEVDSSDLLTILTRVSILCISCFMESQCYLYIIRTVGDVYRKLQQKPLVLTRRENPSN